MNPLDAEPGPPQGWISLLGGPVEPHAFGDSKLTAERESRHAVDGLRGRGATPQQLGDKTERLNETAPATSRRERRVVGLLADLLIAVAGVSGFFARAIFSGGDRVLGSLGDGRLILVLHEHWALVASGKTSWWTTIFFWPERQTLGFSDGLVLDSVFYLPLRALGLDPFIASTVTVAVVMVLAWCAVVGLVRSIGHRRWVGHCAASILVVGNTAVVQTAHPQLLAISWLWIALWGLCCIASGVRAHLRRSLGAFVLGFLPLTAFYVAWGFLICCMLGVLASSVLIGGRRTARALQPVVWRVSSLSLLPGLVLAAVTYLSIPGARHRVVTDQVAFALEPRALLHVGKGNVVWGWVTQQPEGVFAADFSFAVPFGLGLTAALAVISATRKVLRVQRAERSLGDVAVVVAGLVALFMLLLPMRVGSFEVWSLTRFVLPAASAIRVIGRAWIFLPPLLVSALLVFSRTTSSRRQELGADRRWRLLLVAFLIAEQVNSAGTWQISRREELAAVSRPPPECDVIAALGPSWHGGWDYVQMDAMMTATLYGIPTVNGYSGQSPRDFAFDAPREPRYSDAIGRLAESLGTETVLCVVTLTSGDWMIHTASDVR